MNLDLLVANIVSPPLLFFLLGVVAALIKSDLEVPQPVPKFLAMYLLMAIGFKGGVELAHGFSADALKGLVASVAMAFVLPAIFFAILRQRLDAKTSAAVAATYGSVSAVTFVTAVSFLDRNGVPFGGHMVAALALMESPAIIVGVFLARRFSADSAEVRWGHLLREACFNGSVVLILGSLAIGAVVGSEGASSLKPFTGDIFKGMLCFFLLDMGVLAARRIGALREGGLFLPGFAVLAPPIAGLVAIGLARLIGLGQGDALLFAVLCASASYIAVPAAMRMAIPEANPSIYVSMALGITFPFNIALGLPLYFAVIRRVWGGL